MIYSILLLGIGLASSSIGMLFLIRVVGLLQLRVSSLERRFDEKGR